MAEFKDEKSIQVGGQVYSADHILIAVGGTPRALGVPGEVRSRRREGGGG
jgi:pyruvate/2-oxoglutarate dehydrogenase complex dihydrolipoamide dehydrogenase (E3) component